MSIYFRKSKKLGPLRFTFSKRGITTSFGSKFFRVTHSPSGDYLSSSVDGVTMRQKLEHHAVEEPTTTSQAIADHPIAAAPKAQPRRHTARKLLFYIAYLAIIGALFGYQKPGSSGATMEGFLGVVGGIVTLVLILRSRRSA